MLLAMAGTLVLMAGVLLGVVSAVLGLFESGGWLLPSVIAGGLIATGLFCGAIIVVISKPAGRWRGMFAARRPPVPPSQRRPGQAPGDSAASAA